MKGIPVSAIAKKRTFSSYGLVASAGGMQAIIELPKHVPEKTGMAFMYSSTSTRTTTVSW